MHHEQQRFSRYLGTERHLHSVYLRVKEVTALCHHLREWWHLRQPSHLGPESKGGAEDNAFRSGCYLDGQLELFMLPLQLLRLRQRAGIDQAGIEHWLSIADPSQNLGSLEKHTGEWPSAASPELLPSLWRAIFYSLLKRGQKGSGMLIVHIFPVSAVISHVLYVPALLSAPHVTSSLHHPVVPVSPPNQHCFIWLYFMHVQRSFRAENDIIKFQLLASFSF